MKTNTNNRIEKRNIFNEIFNIVEKRNIFNEIFNIVKKNKSIDLSDKNYTFSHKNCKMKLNRIYLKTTCLRNSNGQFRKSILGGGNVFYDVMIDAVTVNGSYDDTYDFSKFWPKNQLKMFRNILVKETENK